MQWRIQGGGGAGGPPPPLLGHDVGFLTLGPKLDPRLDPPPLFACRPKAKMDPSGGSRVCVWQGWSPRRPLWMTSHGQCPRGGGACECPRVGVFFNFSEGGWRHADNVQGGGGCLWKILYPRLDPPPPFKNPGSAPVSSVMSDVTAMPVLVIGLLTIPPWLRDPRPIW